MDGDSDLDSPFLPLPKTLNTQNLNKPTDFSFRVLLVSWLKFFCGKQKHVDPRMCFEEPAIAISFIKNQGSIHFLFESAGNPRLTTTAERQISVAKLGSF